jgi:DHA1 family tetracycline resistance protein-like MFS transporter
MTKIDAVVAPAVKIKGRKAAVAFILVNVVLDTLSLGIIIPVLPGLIQAFQHGDAAAAARTIGLFSTVWAFMQFVCAPVLGALSDRYGRRPVLLGSLTGLGLDYLLMAMAPSLPWLFVGRVISGMTAAGGATANAYIADVTPPEKRAATYGYIGAAWGLGFVAGPTLGGVLGQIDLRLPFWVSMGLTLVAALYGLFVLPESLPKDRRAAFSLARANPLGSLTLLRSHPELLGLSAVNFLMQLAHYVLPTVFVLYAANRYGWTPLVTGPALALTGVCNIIVQMLLVKPIVARIGERGAVLAGLGFGAAGFLIYGLAPNGWVFLVGTPVFGLIGLFGPGFQGLITRRVKPDEQGRLQGANSALVGIAGMIGPGLFSLTYAGFITQSAVHLPGAAFILAALLMVFGMLLALFVARRADAAAHRDKVRLPQV